MQSSYLSFSADDDEPTGAGVGVGGHHDPFAEGTGIGGWGESDGISYDDLAALISACKHDEMTEKQKKIKSFESHSGKKKRKSKSSGKQQNKEVATAVVAGRLKASEFDELSTIEQINFAISHVDTFKKETEFSKERQERIREGLIKIFEIQAQNEKRGAKSASSSLTSSATATATTLSSDKDALPPILPRSREGSRTSNNNENANSFSSLDKDKGRAVDKKGGSASSTGLGLLDKLRHFLS